jgi:uncharacterized protein YcfJ
MIQPFARASAYTLRPMHAPMPLRSAFAASALAASLALAPATGAAQQLAQRSVVQAEDVRYDHAQVIRARPVYQTLNATRMEERCRTPAGVVVVEPAGAEKGRFERFVEAVRGVLTGDSGESNAPRTVTERPSNASGCEMVQVERQFRRPIAYDVDYVYKGAKYRSRLPEDPGNLVRVRVSVTPVVGAVDEP